jgi:hypothetical protein
MADGERKERKKNEGRKRKKECEGAPNYPIY